MIYLAWVLNFFLALFIAMMIRRLFENIILKRLGFAFILSLLMSFWFLYPGSDDLAPILPIYFLDIIESESLVQMRLIRPFVFIFFLILIFDFIIFRYKSKKK
ncbi:MAG: hypothetical protein CBE41_04300 [Gammaproteobacteria bacterium TMED281]|nr:MAG: hypothetical protein CBE41_04300 [Gammaproteobacteria bacterium TMED281]|tara:strand:- start:1133 stop:1441 length:309 start_codon:yes stop_codon:yes gene_type:complete